MKINLIGIGMGNPDTLTLGAKQAIESSDLLIGAPRLLEPFESLSCEKHALIKPSEILEVLEAAAAEGCETASVLFSGDVGFYSGATSLFGKLDDLDGRLEGCEIEAIPGISSLVYFCAKLKTTWQDLFLVSAHGREHNALGAIQTHARTFLLTGGTTKARDICVGLVERGLGDVRVCAGERLSYEDERIVSGTASELAKIDFADLTVLLVENPRPIERSFAAPSLSDEAFVRGAVPMTKEEVRELSISKLHIQRDSVIWDVGAGTGSVSVEAAFAANEGLVYAIERNPEALGLLEENRTRFGLSNLNIVSGSAPEVLTDLPAPDRVFIGGSAGKMKAIMALALEKNPEVRFVVNAITLETVAETLRCLDELALEDVDIVQVSCARAKEAGSYHLMMAQNPVYIVSATGALKKAPQESDEPAEGIGNPAQGASAC